MNESVVLSKLVQAYLSNKFSKKFSLHVDYFRKLFYLLNYIHVELFDSEEVKVMPVNVKNGEVKKNHSSIEGAYVRSMKDKTVEALEGVVDVVTGTTSTTMKAGEKISDDFTSLTKRMIFNTIKGAAEVTAVLGSAALENARGGVKGVGTLGGDAGQVAKEAAIGTIHGASEVGNEAGEAAKKAAIGLIHGSAEVGTELGKVCKQGAMGFIQGAGEVTAELGSLAMKNALGLVDGGTETTLKLEDGILAAAKKLYNGISEIKAQQAAQAAPAPQSAIEIANLEKAKAREQQQ